MDASLLMESGFWGDTKPHAIGNFPGRLPECEELGSHVLFETSGTSGTPRWIALSKEALLISANAVNRHLDVGPESCWGLALPLHHVGGFGVVARAHAAVCDFREFGRRWHVSEFAAWISEKKITHTSMVPTQIYDLVAAGIKAPSSLRAIVVGGGRLEENVGRAARALGWPVLASYGMTEAGSQIATQALSSLRNPYQPAPIPLLPIWRTELSADQSLCIAGPALFSGTVLCDGEVWHYHRRSTDWYQTSDRVMVNSNELTPIGRTDTLVKVLGELVSLEDIERELLHLSNLKLQTTSFAVVALPDPRRGHLLIPVFENSVDPMLSALVLERYARQASGLRSLQLPRRIENLPRSPLGKIRRPEIVANL